MLHAVNACHWSTKFFAFLSGKSTCAVLLQHAATWCLQALRTTKWNIGDGNRVTGEVLATSATVLLIQFVSECAANQKRSNKIWQ